MRFFVLLALIAWFGLHGRKPPGGGNGPSKPSDSKPSTRHGSIDASKDVARAQDAIDEKADLGTPNEGESDTTQPGETGPGKDPIGGTVTHGKNSLQHMRSHAQHIRTAARADGVDIPTGVGKPATQQAIKDYIQYVVDNPEQVGVGRYMSVDNAIWSRRGDLIIVRKPDGEWITALSASRGGAAGGAPWNNPSPPAAEN
ncbi:hypothetical protein [Kibdelosporangium aridum]|uniref:hypothetical protein n=1 Tax=Kibdelosporangium aridum TaxID=2030 RepID=UPI0005250370